MKKYFVIHIVKEEHDLGDPVFFVRKFTLNGWVYLDRANHNTWHTFTHYFACAFEDIEDAKKRILIHKLYKKPKEEITYL